jgi:hypothetical protein
LIFVWWILLWLGWILVLAGGSRFLPGGSCSGWIRSWCFLGLDLDFCLVDLDLAGGWILTVTWWILPWAGIVVLSGVDLLWILVPAGGGYPVLLGGSCPGWG